MWPFLLPNKKVFRKFGQCSMCPKGFFKTKKVQKYEAVRYVRKKLFGHKDNKYCVKDASYVQKKIIYDWEGTLALSKSLFYTKNFK